MRKKGRKVAPGRRSSGALVALVMAFALAACSVAAGDTGPGRGQRFSAAGHGGPILKNSATSSSRAVANLSPPQKRPVHFGVGLTIVTWDEVQGTTENFVTGTSQPGRTMQVEILYPTLGQPSSVLALAAPAYRFGPYPVVVFAHGYKVDPNTYRALLTSWVQAGYVIVAPFFPDTSLPAVQAQQGADTESDIFNQPSDMAFVVSQVFAAAAGSAPTHASYLAGLVDPAQLILAGQSDGGDTVAGLMYDKVYAATRASMPVKPIAVAIFSGAELSRAADVFSPSPGGPPVLVVQSLTDACNDPANSSQIYNMLTGEKWFLAIDNSTHLGPYVGLGAAAPVVEQVTTGFFDLATRRGNITPVALGRDGNRPGISTITNAPRVPWYTAPGSFVDGCTLPPGAPTD